MAPWFANVRYNRRQIAGHASAAAAVRRGGDDDGLVHVAQVATTFIRNRSSDSEVVELA